MDESTIPNGRTLEGYVCDAHYTCTYLLRYDVEDFTASGAVDGGDGQDWTHVTVVCDKGKIKEYINGVRYMRSGAYQSVSMREMEILARVEFGKSHMHASLRDLITGVYEDYKAGRLVPCLLPEPSLFQQAAATYQMGIVPASIIGRLLPQL